MIVYGVLKTTLTICIGSFQNSFVKIEYNLRNYIKNLIFMFLGKVCNSHGRKLITREYLVGPIPNPTTPQNV